MRQVMRVILYQAPWIVIRMCYEYLMKLGWEYGALANRSSRATNIMPTTARVCYDYSQPDCTNAACFQWYICLARDKNLFISALVANFLPLIINSAYTTAPYCYTEVLYGETQVWIDCTATATTFTVGSHAATTASQASVTPRPGVASPTPIFSTITSAPNATPSTPSARNSSGGSSGLSGGAIAGIAIGAFVVVVVIAVLGFLLWRKSRRASEAQQVQPPMEPAKYAPHQPPYSPNLPHYQPVVGQTIGTPVSYHEPPKNNYYNESGHGPAELASTQPAELPSNQPAELS